MVDLGTLPGDVRSGAVAVNDDGLIVGYSEDASGVRRAVAWRLGPSSDPDADGDGVLDTVDSDAGSGTNPAGFSNAVQGKATPTTGTIVSGSVTVDDPVDPTKGVRIIASTAAVLTACGGFELDIRGVEP